MEICNYYFFFFIPVYDFLWSASTSALKRKGTCSCGGSLKALSGNDVGVNAPLLVKKEWSSIPSNVGLEDAFVLHWKKEEKNIKKKEKKKKEKSEKYTNSKEKSPMIKKQESDKKLLIIDWLIWKINPDICKFRM